MSSFRDRRDDTTLSGEESRDKEAREATFHCADCFGVVQLRAEAGGTYLSAALRRDNPAATNSMSSTKEAG